VPCLGTILVVDDDPDNRDALAAAFERRGCTVVTARDGVDALAKLSGQPRVCMVLLDMNMPRLDGEGFARLLRADGERCELPIVSMSAGVDRLSVPGVRQHLEKPFALGALDAVVRGVCVDPDWRDRRGS
jgi:chemosensory pili system protein ChpA (sensor histidine kinase/response regulator)